MVRGISCQLLVIFLLQLLAGRDEIQPRDALVYDGLAA